MAESLSQPRAGSQLQRTVRGPVALALVLMGRVVSFLGYREAFPTRGEECSTAGTVAQSQARPSLSPHRPQGSVYMAQLLPDVLL